MPEKEILVNKLILPKKYKTYSLTKGPVKPSKFLQILIQVVCYFALLRQPRTVSYDPKFKDLKKTPYLILCSHAQFLDFFVQYATIGLRPVSSVVSLDAFSLVPLFLIEQGGAIPKRKFYSEIISVLQMRKAIKQGSIVAFYPEARYSKYGEQAKLPPSLAKLIKSLGVPVVTLMNHGHYQVNPCWGNQKKRKVPVHSDVNVTFSKEEIELLSVDEINERLTKVFTYNEYQYLKDNNYLIKEKYRAAGIHRILYKCPHCLTEMQMKSQDSFISCTACDIVYEMLETGDLKCQNGTTIFTTVHDWVKFERENVLKEINNGTYHVTMDVKRTFAFPHPKSLIPIGNSHFVHDLTGITITGNYNNYDYMWHKDPYETMSVQIEYNWLNIKGSDIIAIHTLENGIYLWPENPSVLFKIYLATEILYEKAMNEKNSPRNQ
ncbi:MAG: hypothetical protein LBR37_02770 [Erysipelotrichaceae bacterium]|jgi:1-acyl-sn-glycerol-3-phosphate acyltransferase|nr:hypothetical protein [Erysipelotrichaceae bacterium]